MREEQLETYPAQCSFCAEWKPVRFYLNNHKEKKGYYYCSADCLRNDAELFD